MGAPCEDGRESAASDDSKNSTTARLPGIAEGNHLQLFRGDKGTVISLVIFVFVPWLIFWTGPTQPGGSNWFFGLGWFDFFPQFPHWLPAFLALSFSLLTVAILFFIVFPVEFWNSASAATLNVLVFLAFSAGLLGIFSASYLQLVRNYPSCLSQHHLNHVEALYFATTSFTAAGPSDITPHSGLCRMTVAFQTIVGLTLISLIVAAMVTRLVQLGEGEEQ
jgi:hypothetical protein